jgi:hypothetical protein
MRPHFIWFKEKPDMKIRHVLFSRAQLGWVCEITFTSITARQFTAEEIELKEGCNGHGLISIWLAFWRARRAARQWAKANSPLSGEREAKGWAI